MPALGHALDQDWERLVAFYEFPKAHWTHLRTEPDRESATAVIWKTLLIAERTFRRLDAPELLAEVAEGVTYVSGERVKPSQTTAERKSAA
jgi:hypothetical protein